MTIEEKKSFEIELDQLKKVKESVEKTLSETRIALENAEEQHKGCDETIKGLKSDVSVHKKNIEELTAKLNKLKIIADDRQSILDKIFFLALVT